MPCASLVLKWIVQTFSLKLELSGKVRLLNQLEDRTLASLNFFG